MASQRSAKPTGRSELLTQAVLQHLGQFIPFTFSFLLSHRMPRISCVAHTTGCLLPPPPPSSRWPPPQAPLICLTPLSDHAQRGGRVSTYWVHSRCQVLQQAPSATPGSVYTSVGFKRVSATRIKAQHSRTSVSTILFIRCSVYWRTAHGATCLPPSPP